MKVTAKLIVMIIIIISLFNLFVVELIYNKTMHKDYDELYQEVMTIEKYIKLKGI